VSGRGAVGAGLATAAAALALAACSPAASNAPSAATGPTRHFVNSPAFARAPILAQRYAQFSFDYPGNWSADADNGSAGAEDFVRFVRQDRSGVTVESFRVGPYRTTGDAGLDRAQAPQLLGGLERQVNTLPGYRRVSLGEATTVDGLPGVEMTFSAAPQVNGKTLAEFGRIILVPGPAGQHDGVTLILLGTDASGELHGVADLGVKGQMPVILNSFRFGAAPGG
jgi:hypothetical protein